MSADWNDQTLDEMLFGVQDTAWQSSDSAADASHQWTLGEVDALLDGDGLLTGFNNYSISDPAFSFADVPQPEEPEFTYDFTAEPATAAEAQPEEPEFTYDFTAEPATAAEAQPEEPEFTYDFTAEPAVAAEAQPEEPEFTYDYTAEPATAAEAQPEEPEFTYDYTAEPAAAAEAQPEEPVFTYDYTAEPATAAQAQTQEPEYAFDVTPEPPLTDAPQPKPHREGGRVSAFGRLLSRKRAAGSETADEPSEPAPIPQQADFTYDDAPQTAPADAPRSADEPAPQEQPAGESPTRVIGSVTAAAEEADGERDRELERTRVASPKPQPKPKPKKKPDAEMMDGQMMLTGFESDDDVEQVDEAVAEKELQERRKSQVKKFKLYDFAEKYEPDLPPKTDVFEPEPEPSAESDDADENEYVRLGDRKRIGRILQEQRRSMFLSVCALAASLIVLIVLSSLTRVISSDARPVLYAISLVVLSLSVAVSIPTFRKGMMDLIHRKPSCDSATCLATIAAFVQAILAFVLPGTEEMAGTFCAAAVFSLLLCRIAKLFEAVGTVSNFKFCAFTASERLHAIRAFEQESDTYEIGRSLSKKHPKLRFSQKTKFPALFRKHADFRSMMDGICRILLPAGFGAALIMAVAGGIKTQSVLGGFCAFAGAMCVAMPAGAAFTVSVPLVLLMQNLNRHGGMIVSPEAACANAGVHGVAVDAIDLYDQKKTDIFCFQDYGTIYFDAMYLYAAALAIGAHTPAEGAFLRAVGNPDILPPVQSMIYEERLGVSATINRQSVLLGSRNLLINHSIDPPPKSAEVPYLQDHKRVLYLAVDGKVAAMFVIDYVQKQALSVPLQILQDNDTNLLVYAPDCNVSEDFISTAFGLKKGGVQLLDPAAGKLLRQRLAEETDHMPATVLHNGSTESLMRTLADACVMSNIQRVAAFVGVIGCGIGWLVSFILMLAVGIETVNWIFATVYPAIWIALSAGIGIWQARKAMK